MTDIRFEAIAYYFDFYVYRDYFYVDHELLMWEIDRRNIILPRGALKVSFMDYDDNKSITKNMAKVEKGGGVYWGQVYR